MQMLAVQKDLRAAKVATAKAVKTHREKALRSCAFHSWHVLQQTHAPRRAAVELMIRAAASQRRRAMLSRSWLLWVERCRQQLVKDQQRKLGERHYVQRLQGQALRAWQLWVDAQQAYQHAVWLALQKWREWRLSGCLYGWRSWSHLVAEERWASVRSSVPAVLQRAHVFWKGMKA